MLPISFSVRRTVIPDAIYDTYAHTRRSHSTRGLTSRSSVAFRQRTIGGESRCTSTRSTSERAPSCRQVVQPFVSLVVSLRKSVEAPYEHLLAKKVDHGTHKLIFIAFLAGDAAKRNQMIYSRVGIWNIPMLLPAQLQDMAHTK